MPKDYRFATLDSVINALNQGATIHLADIRPSLHDSYIWQGFYGMGGGYMPDDDSRFYARNLRAVVDSHCETVCDFDEKDRAPSGFRAGLMSGSSEYSRDGRTCFEVCRMTVREATSDY
jgi:hypothetical protein